MMNRPVPEPEPDDREEVVIPVVEEEVDARAVPVKTGSVRVEKHVERRIRRIDLPVRHDEVEVRRIPVNKVVAEVPPVRKRGDLIIVPVIEEELVVTRRLVLKEEVHLIRRRTRDRVVKEVSLERERAEVRRTDASGRILDPPHPARNRGGNPGR